MSEPLSSPHDPLASLACDGLTIERCHLVRLTIPHIKGSGRNRSLQMANQHFRLCESCRHLIVWNPHQELQSSSLLQGRQPEGMAGHPNAGCSKDDWSPTAWPDVFVEEVFLCPIHERALKDLGGETQYLLESLTNCHRSHDLLLSRGSCDERECELIVSEKRLCWPLSLKNAVKHRNYILG